MDKNKTSNKILKVILHIFFIAEMQMAFVICSDNFVINKLQDYTFFDRDAFISSLSSYRQRVENDNLMNKETITFFIDKTSDVMAKRIEDDYKVEIIQYDATYPDFFKEHYLTSAKVGNQKLFSKHYLNKETHEIHHTDYSMENNSYQEVIIKNNSDEKTMTRIKFNNNNEVETKITTNLEGLVLQSIQYEGTRTTTIKNRDDGNIASIEIKDLYEGPLSRSIYTWNKDAVGGVESDNHYKITTTNFITNQTTEEYK